MGMIAHYLSKAGDNQESFLSSYRILGVQRNLRILGIFARLARHKGKYSYLALIPRVRNYVERTLRAAEFEVWRDDLMSLLYAPAEDLERLAHV